MPTRDPHDAPDHCDRCRAPLALGDWPWCPHGRYGGGATPDTLWGGPQWIENLGPDPVWVTSKTQLRQEAAARGLRWDPPPRGPRVQGAEAGVRGRFNGGACPTYDHGD